MMRRSIAALPTTPEVMGGNVPNDADVIVDDAIDSGHSMLCVYDMIRHVYPCSDIYTAVFTTTQKQPVCTADFSAYSDTLVRFPWSLDGKYD